MRRGWPETDAAGSAAHLRACVELAAAMAVVGSGVVVGKVLVARVPVVLAGGLRLAFACAVLVPLLLVAERGRPRLSHRGLGVLTLQAFTGIFLFYALLGEPFRWTHVAGGASVIGAIGLLARERAALLSS